MTGEGLRHCRQTHINSRVDTRDHPRTQEWTGAARLGDALIMTARRLPEARWLVSTQVSWQTVTQPIKLLALPFMPSGNAVIETCAEVIILMTVGPSRTVGRQASTTSTGPCVSTPLLDV